MKIKGKFSVFERTLSWLLSVAMLFGVFIFTDTVTINVHAGDNVMFGGKSVWLEYGPGDYFTDNGNACTDHGTKGIHSSTDESACNCKCTYNGTKLGACQCFGYARYIQTVLFGKNSYNSSGSFYKVSGASVSAGSLTADKLKSIIRSGNVKPGAHIRTNGSAHSMIITQITDSGFSIIQANGSNNNEYSGHNACRVGTYTYTWSSYVSSTYGSRGINYIEMPYDYNIPDNDFPGAEDTSYAVPVSLKAKYKDNTYDGSGNVESNRWIDAGDDCYIEKVYTNGFCRVEYPAGNTRRWAYAKASLFDIPKKQDNDFPGAEDTSYAVPVSQKAKQHDNTYDDNGNVESNRWIDEGDDCYIEKVYINGFCRVEYPAGNERRWAYAKASLFDIPKKEVIPQGHVMSESEAAGRTIPDGDYYIISEISQDFFVDIPGDNFDTPNGKNLEMWIWDSFMPDRNGYDCFHIEYLNNGFYSIRQFGTNMCVDVNGASLSMGENIQMWENNGSNAQQWSIERTSHGYRMRSRCNAYYMDIENGIYGGSTNIRCWEGNDSKAQSFSFIPRDPNERPVSDGVYTIKTKVDRNCFLDVADVPGNFYAGSNIQIWKAAPGDPEEKYTIKYAGDGWYRICEKTSGLLMELADPNSGFLEASRNVQLFSDNGGNHQLWKIKQNSDGTYFIINKASGYYLDLEGENTNNGTNVSQHPYNGNNNQRWLIEPYTNTYTISFSEENITMKKGNSKIVNINFTGDDIYTLEYQLNNSNVCTAQWGDVDYGRGTTSVTINAVGAGSTTVAIRLKDSNDKILFSKNINVTVTGDSYSISFSADNLTMKKDSSKTVNIRFTGENIYTLSYDLSNSNICTAQWGDVDYGTGTTSITINAIGAGNASVTINLKDCDDKILFSKKITISVTAPTYTISYNVNQGYGEFTSQIKTDGLSLTLSSVKPTRTGYEFLGWSTNPNATTAEYQPGSSFSKNENTTLYAVWKATSYTVSYNMNGGNGSISSQTKMYGQDLTLSSTKPTRTGYEFIGWNTNSSATSAQYQPNEKYTTNSSATLYAVWKSNTCTISYNMNGGSGSINPQIVVYGQSVTISGVIPTRAGYQFLGWNTSANATTAQYQPGGKYTANSSATLYAVWKKLVENAPQIIVENKTVSAGSEVKVNVSLKNNPGISSMGLTLKYDKTKLTLKAVNYNSAMGGQSMQPQTMDSPVILNWVSPVADYSGDGTYAELVFKVSDKAKSGTIPIEITYDSNNVYNLNDENIAFEVKNGTVTVRDYIPGDINNDGVVNNKDFSRLFQYLSGWNVVINEAALDVNGDGSVNNKDATRLFQYVSGWNVNIY